MRSRLVAAAALATLWTLPLAAASPSASAGTGSNVVSDFDGDGIADLAIGAPCDPAGGVGCAGAVVVIFGDVVNMSSDRSQLVSLATPGVQGDPSVGAGFGEVLAAGDFDGDGFSDLAVGMPSQRVGGKTDAGAVHVLFGSPGGLTGDGDLLLTQATTGIPGDLAEFRGFGSSLAAGDLGRGAASDLVIGVENQSAGGTPQAGALAVLYGSAGGPDAATAQLWTAATKGVPGAPLQQSDWGTALAIGNFGRGPTKDLAIGAPNDTAKGRSDAGSVTVLYGRSSGLSSRHAVRLTEKTLGRAVRNGDQLGSALAAANFGGGANADLAIGVPGASVEGVIGAGAVDVLYGSGPAGLVLGSDQRLTQAGTGTGSTEQFDGFGDSLAGGDVGKGSPADLAIGIPREDFGSEMDAGAVTLVFATASGLDPSDAVGLLQGPFGGANEAGDRFGDSLAILPLNASAPLDLAIGSPLDDIGDVGDAGAVYDGYGSADGTLTTTQSWDRGTVGQDGAPTESARFGAALA
jgi:FG-GAP repeat